MTVVTTWQRTWSADAVQETSLADVQQHRWTVQELQRLCLLSCAFEHWLLPLAKQRYGAEGEMRVKESWHLPEHQKKLWEDLDLLLAARGSADLFPLTTLETLPCPCFSALA